MSGEVNCIFTKALIPFVEQEVGPEGVAAILRTAGRSREYLVADHNWIPLALADELVRLSRTLMREPDEERWARRYTEFFMDWKPSREERSYIGSYTMGVGSPRAIFERIPLIQRGVVRHCAVETLEIGRSHGRFRRTPHPGFRILRWECVWTQVTLERFPTNWGLPRAKIVERQCAATGADACVWDVSWKNPALGPRFWAPALAIGAIGSSVLPIIIGRAEPVSPLVAAVATVLPLAVGVSVGVAWREEHRRYRTQRLLDLQSEEIIHSNAELEKKFRDLETKIEQLSLLIDLSGAVNATLDPEKIYDQALDRLVHRMGYQGAYLYLVDPHEHVIRAHKMAGGTEARATFEAIEFPLGTASSLACKVATTGRAVTVADVEHTDEPVAVVTARLLGVRSVVMVPLCVKERIFGVLGIVSTRSDDFRPSDVDLISAVANHVALAIERAESFQTIEELSRGLEDKVHVRTEQLRAANEELGAAYRNLQATQMQLVQREKMASVGQLVAGVAHELNNPIGFVSSNVTMLGDFVRRMRSMLDAYRALALPEAARAEIEARWESLKVDYALRYLDSMIDGIREGAERARKIVRDLRVFARGQDDVWQAVDLHEEIESSLTLLNHLLKDRVTVHRKPGDLPAVECIRSQMDQVFLNLLANAAQAIDGSGEITIETEREGETAVVTVSDTGTGIPSEFLGRIFDPFFTTKPVGEGTGLGLSISYEIVKKHGGEISARNRPGGGAVFTVRIPLQRAA